MKFFHLNPPWYVPLILLLAALLVGLIKVRSLWEEMHEDEDPASDRERLSELEQAHAAGELNEEELRRIRDLLSRSETLPVAAPEPPQRRPPIPSEPPKSSADPLVSDDSPVRPDSP